jgi:hypothetical protein
MILDFKRGKAEDFGHSGGMKWPKTLQEVAWESGALSRWFALIASTSLFCGPSFMGFALGCMFFTGRYFIKGTE